MQKKYIIGLCLSIAVLYMACKKEQIEPLPITMTTDMANVKIVHASAYNTNFSVQLKINENRVSNAFTYSTPFPGGGLNTGGSNLPWYLALNPGSNKISMSVPKVGTNTDSLSLYSGNHSFEAGKHYTVYLSDTAANTQATVITENKTLPGPGTSRYKFVNLLPNVPALDLYVGTTKVASNVTYKSVSPDFTMNTGDTVRFYIRPAGAAPTTTQVAMYPTIVPFVAAYTVPQQRLMTIFARGYNGTTGNRIPQISLTFN